MLTMSPGGYTVTQMYRDARCVAGDANVIRYGVDGDNGAVDNGAAGTVAANRMISPVDSITIRGLNHNRHRMFLQRTRYVM